MNNPRKVSRREIGFCLYPSEGERAGVRGTPTFSDANKSPFTQ
jgi:hypothetical protein